jgi:hypothetical protein
MTKLKLTIEDVQIHNKKKNVTKLMR